jgi:hypothetical protein
MTRQSIDNLHEDITKVVLDAQAAGHYGKVLEVVDPSPGMWGGEPIEGLVTVVYECSCGYHPQLPMPHSHHALFGPTDEKDRKEGEPVDHYSLYAD